MGTPALLSYEVWSALTERLPGASHINAENRSTWKTEATRTDERKREIALLRAIGAAVAGGLYIIIFPLYQSYEH